MTDMQRRIDNKEQLIEELHKMRDDLILKHKSTGLTNRNVLVTVVDMLELVLSKIE
jgi:hypothetical protein